MPAEDLFDDEFQRKLDYLAMVSKRVFSGAMRAERRTKKSARASSSPITATTPPATISRYLDWHAYQRFGACSSASTRRRRT
jgi:hypothetical protein